MAAALQQELERFQVRAGLEQWCQIFIENPDSVLFNGVTTTDLIEHAERLMLQLCKDLLGIFRTPPVEIAHKLKLHRIARLLYKEVRLRVEQARALEPDQSLNELQRKDVARAEFGDRLLLWIKTESENRAMWNFALRLIQDDLVELFAAERLVNNSAGAREAFLFSTNHQFSLCWDGLDQVLRNEERLRRIMTGNQHLQTREESKVRICTRMLEDEVYQDHRGTIFHSIKRQSRRMGEQNDVILAETDVEVLNEALEKVRNAIAHGGCDIVNVFPHDLLLSYETFWAGTRHRAEITLNNLATLCFLLRKQATLEIFEMMSRVYHLQNEDA